MLSSGCDKAAEKMGKDASAAPEISVQVLRVQPDPSTSAEDAPGTIRPVETAILSSKISGTILDINADPGKIVKAGDLLGRIDDREIRARLENARAGLDQAQRDFVRFEKLHKDRVITTQEFEVAQTRLRTALAAEEEAKTLLAYCNIVAPFDGVVTQRMVQRGDLAVPGKALVEIENPGNLRLEAQVPESLVASLQIGAPIPVTVNAANSSTEGKIAEIAPASDPASRTTTVKIDLLTTKGLRSGQFGRARIPTSSAPVLRVPASSVFSKGQLDFVFVIDQGKAFQRIVRTGRREDGKIEILSGLDTGDAVVTSPNPALFDGAKAKAAQP